MVRVWLSAVGLACLFVSLPVCRSTHIKAADQLLPSLIVWSLLDRLVYGCLLLLLLLLLLVLLLVLLSDVVALCAQHERRARGAHTPPRLPPPSCSQWRARLLLFLVLLCIPLLFKLLRGSLNCLVSSAALIL